MQRNDFYTEQEMAEILGYTKGSLRCYRYKGINHPPYVKLGSRIVYPRKEYEQWCKRNVKLVVAANDG